VVLNHGGDEPLQLAEVHGMPAQKKSPAGPAGLRVSAGVRSV
jgi:hypothetical protein